MKRVFICISFIFLVFFLLSPSQSFGQFILTIDELKEVGKKNKTAGNYYYFLAKKAVRSGNRHDVKKLQYYIGLLWLQSFLLMSC
ncbi:hypothetical protein VU04_08870 [Desulfobulbus sp. TB]|nr:hypothetical protein [Desulfobulbus sp. TB]